MLKFTIATLVALTTLAASTALAVDTIKLTSGRSVGGKITLVTRSEVAITVGGKKETFAVKDIDVIRYDDDPKELTQARNLIKQGKYQQGRDLLEKLDAKEISRREISQDVSFFSALAAMRLAEMGSGSKLDAGKQLLAFERANDESYHYFTVCQAIGDLLVSLGKFDQAQAFYAKLAKAPWPEYKMRADVLGARALQQNNEHPEAMKKFDEVLASKESGKGADRERLAATLGKAASLAATGKNPEAIALAEAVIQKADPEDADLHARAYNVLGNSYLAGDKKKDALLAFLHVDLLYPNSAEQHAEALFHLGQLWDDVQKADRANQAKEKLKERYPHSRWAQQAGK